MSHCKTEYREHLGIDFELSQVPFSRIEELVRARDAGIHADTPRIMKGYLRDVPNARFVDAEDQFCVDPASYQAAVSDVKGFMEWVVDEIRKQAAPPEAQRQARMEST